MQKIFKDVQVGDICYMLDIENNVKICKVTNIEKLSTFVNSPEYIVTYDNEVKGSARSFFDRTNYGGWGATVFFDTKTLIEVLNNRKDKINEVILKYMN